MEKHLDLFQPGSLIRFNLNISIFYPFYRQIKREPSEDVYRTALK